MTSSDHTFASYRKPLDTGVSINGLTCFSVVPLCPGWPPDLRFEVSGWLRVRLFSLADGFFRPSLEGGLLLFPRFNICARFEHGIHSLGGTPPSCRIMKRGVAVCVPRFDVCARFEQGVYCLGGAGMCRIIKWGVFESVPRLNICAFLKTTHHIWYGGFLEKGSGVPVCAIGLRHIKFSPVGSFLQYEPSMKPAQAVAPSR